MAYYLDLFSPETYEAFSRSARDVSGFRLRQESIASRIKIGDKLICYLTKLSRWIGVLEVVSQYYKDDTALFLATDDPFVVRFKVKPLVWLDKEHAIPIRDDEVWNTLSFTKEHEKTSAIWTGRVRSVMLPAI
jgi:predicted RNA-binding protein